MARRARRVTLAISLHQMAYGETSQIVEFLTEDHGRIAALARGSHRPKNSYQGAVDALVYARIAFSQYHGRGLDLLLSRDVLTAFPELRRDLDRFHAASYLTELVRHGVPINHDLPGMFALFRGGLVALHDRPRDELMHVIFAFEWRFLKILGLMPALDRCVVCSVLRGRGGRVRDGSSYGMSVERGGLVCSTCARATLRCDASRLDLLDRMAERPLSDWIGHPELAAAGPGIREFLDCYVSYHLEHPVMNARHLSRLFAGPSGKAARS